MATDDSTTVKQTLDRNITAINTRDLDGLLANQQPDVQITLPGGVTLTGRDELRAFIQAQWAAFPDGRITFGAQVLGADSAATEIVFTGTHTGSLPGPDGPIAPTSKTVTLHSASFSPSRTAGSRASASTRTRPNSPARWPAMPHRRTDVR